MRKIQLVKRKECRILTWQGKLVFILVFISIIFVILKFAPAFLSTNKPNNGNILVLDGQMPDFAVRKAIQIFESGDYKASAQSFENTDWKGSAYYKAKEYDKAYDEFKRKQKSTYTFKPNKIASN